VNSHRRDAEDAEQKREEKKKMFCAGTHEIMNKKGKEMFYQFFS
jgi:hypothetical protein